MAHPLLERQLRRLGIAPGEAPGPEAWRLLLEQVGRAYQEHDDDRYLLERSLALSSGEMRELNEMLRASRRQLAIERDHLAAIFASLQDAVCVLDGERRLQRINPAGERLLGTDAGAAAGRPLAELARGIEFDASPGAAPGGDVRIDRADGASFPAEVTTAPIRGPAGALGVVVVLRDLTTRRQLELDLRQAQKLEAVGRLAAGIAHEINTPAQFVHDSVSFVADSLAELLPAVEAFRAAVAAILAGAPAGAAALRARELDEQADLDDALGRIPRALTRALEGLERIRRIVRSMKDLAHPDRHEMTAHDLNRVIESAVTVASSEYKHVADLELDLGELPPVACHAGEIGQVVLNLVVNAAHAIADAAADAARPRSGRGTIRVETRREGEWARIAIGDTGTGIPEAIRARIFDPFFTTKEVGKGTGQGLSFVRAAVVGRHHGELRFESEVGKGTTFFVRLPLAAVPARPVAAVPA